MKNKEYYCKECGKKMLVGVWSASQIRVKHYDSGGGYWCDLDWNYNQETGEENLAMVYECPEFDYKRFLFWKNENGHSRFAVYKGSHYYGIKLK